jgi:UDP-N-acetylmuramyl pentapeptide phosphotransferase/UDP-N-acetylglucosamine-1-phosphate transferase/glycosyltransferase involved in cell wall biosynthesis
MIGINFTYALVYAGAVLLALMLTPATIWLARSWGLMDLPNARNVTKQPTPRIGGLAIAAATVLAAGAGLLLADLPLERFDGVGLAVIGGAALLILGVGIIDDLMNVPSRFKLLALIVAAAAVCGVGVQIEGVIWSGQTVLALGLMAWPITILWITGITVSINFIDGLDGLAAGITAIAAGLLAMLLVLSGVWPVALGALALLGALTGFLFFNFHPAKTFMGDCGSMFIGFTFACLCVLGHRELGTMAALIVPGVALSVPLLDTSLTLIRRNVVQRRSLFAAEQGHIHHRLLDVGLRHNHAVLFLYGITALAAGMGLLATLGTGWTTIGPLLLLVPLLVGAFRFAGSVRARETLQAVRRNRALNRNTKGQSKQYDEAQLHFRHVATFEAWWRQLQMAAKLLGIRSMRLDVRERDGTPRRLQWLRDGADPSVTTDSQGHPLITASLPVPQRRHDDPLTLQLTLEPDTVLESSGHRLGLFARMLSDHNPANFDEDLAARQAEQKQQERAVAEIEGEPGDDEPTADDRSIDEPPAKASLGARFMGWLLRTNFAKEQADAVATKEKALALIPPVRRGPGDPPRVAIVHDFLYTYAGAERVLEQLVKVYPDADLFSLFDFLPEGERDFIADKPVTTSFIQRMPLANGHHRAFLPLMPLAIEQLDVSGYDVVISSSYLVAKGVITRPDQLHICYCHSPVRFAWDQQQQYLGASRMTWGVKSIVARMILHYIRTWDTRSSNGVDVFVTNSDFVGRRVQKIYRRESTTIYPPVDIESFKQAPGGAVPREEFYVTASRLVPYKRIDLVVQAFTEMPDKRLIVVGDGPEMERLKQIAGPNVQLVGHQPFAKLQHFMRMAKAFVFAAEEDFGIVVVEAQAAGTPAIAFARGGASESVVPNQTGLFFHRQDVASIKEAVEEFEQRDWDPAVIAAAAERFNASRFRKEIAKLVARELAECDQAGRSGVFIPRPPQEPAADAPEEGIEVATVNGRVA